MPQYQEVTWKFAMNKHPTHLHGFPVHIFFRYLYIQSPYFKINCTENNLIIFISIYTDRDGYNWSLGKRGPLSQAVY